MKKVLIVEDVLAAAYTMQCMLSEKVEVILAKNHGEAEKAFADHPDISAVIMDGSLGTAILDTPPLVRKIRSEFGFRGPMVAATNREESEVALIKAGCDCGGEKMNAPAKILELLGLTEQ